MLVEFLLGVVIFLTVLGLLLWGASQSRSSTVVDAKGRVRCRRCDKLVYRNVESAEEAVELAGRRGVHLRAYHERRCGSWHLSSQPPRVRGF